MLQSCFRRPRLMALPLLAGVWAIAWTAPVSSQVAAPPPPPLEVVPRPRPPTPPAAAFPTVTAFARTPMPQSPPSSVSLALHPHAGLPWVPSGGSNEAP